VTTPTEVASRYRIERRLGAGGMSTVYLATDTVLERAVAIKLLAEHLADDPSFVARFRREALAAARLQHPNIVQVFDSGQDPGSGRHFIVMEYVDGPSTADLLRERQMLEVDEAVRITRDACHGLAYAHRAALVHRDVKPGNLLVAAETGATKLADFGIAKAAEQSRITQVGSVLGTAAYLSPEQARGEEAGPPADIYSLGVCTYQFLTGRLPHEYGSLTELALKQQSDEVEPIASYRSDVPSALDEAVRLCLRRDPSARYATALQYSDALAAGLRGEPTEVTMALGGFDAGATQALSATDATEATQALPLDATRAVERYERAPAAEPPPPGRAPRRPAASARPQRAPQRPARRSFPLGRLAATLAILVLGAAAAIAVVTSTGSGPPVERIEENDVQRQVEGLKQLIEENTSR
jgi:serine/threonine-protein kinase